MASQWSVIVDFDGTITETDAEVFIASKLLGRHDRRLEQLFLAYENVEIGLLDYFYGYLDVVDIKSPRFNACVTETPVRRDMVELVKSLYESHQVTIVSEGLDVYIRPIVEKWGLGDIPLISNRVKSVENNRWTILPAKGAEPCDRCLSCKGALVRRMKRESSRFKVAVIGNGASDFCAAKEADAVYARDSLARLCRENGVSYCQWNSAHDIAISNQ